MSTTTATNSGSDGDMTGKANQRASDLADQAKVRYGELKEKAGPLADQAREKAGEYAEKARPAAEQAGKKAGEYAEKAGDMAASGVTVAAAKLDEATKGRWSDKIKSVSDKLSHMLDPDDSTRRAEGAATTPVTGTAASAGAAASESPAAAGPAASAATPVGAEVHLPPPPLVDPVGGFPLAPAPDFDEPSHPSSEAGEPSAPGEPSGGTEGRTSGTSTP